MSGEHDSGPGRKLARTEGIAVELHMDSNASFGTIDEAHREVAHQAQTSAREEAVLAAVLKEMTPLNAGWLVEASGWRAADRGDPACCSDVVGKKVVVAPCPAGLGAEDWNGSLGQEHGAAIHA